MGDLVNGEVFADRHLWCSQHEGAVGGIQLDQKGVMTERGAIGGPVWE